MSEEELSPSRLDELRCDIDSIDDSILALIEQRASKALEVARVKESRGWSSFYDPDRERRVVERITTALGGRLPPSNVSSIFREIMSACLSVQQSLHREPVREGAALQLVGMRPADGAEFDAFDPKLFRKHAQIAIDKMERHLADSSIRGLALTDPALLQQAAQALMTAEHEGGTDSYQKKLSAIIDLYVKTGIQVHSPGYMGRQFSGAVPAAAVIDLVSSVLNQPSSFYEAGQLPNVAERIMADELNQFIGWDRGRFAMVTTSGGSLANLTALLAARNHKFPRFWSEGGAAAGSQMRPAIAVGDAHYCITRAAGIMGIGEAQVVRLPLNENKQICVEQVRPALAAAARRGLNVFCLVASAGTTPVGAFDPIDKLAEIARENDIWLHVDGAHGASLLLSDKLRDKLKGIREADSLTWDAHKMLFVPPPCTLLFYRDKEKSLGAFRQDASYVFESKPNLYTELDSAERNFECTKRPLIMGLWVLWTLYGKALFVKKIDYLCRLAQEAYELLWRQPDFEPLHRPEANILCFRYRPRHISCISSQAMSELQVAIKNRVNLRGNFHISKVNIDGVAALRVVMMNHKIVIDHFRMLLDEIRRAEQESLAVS